MAESFDRSDSPGALTEALRIAAENPEAVEPSKLTDDEIALRARGWFLESWNSVFWQTYVQEGGEDEGYYIGGKEQWKIDGKLDDYQLLRAAGRSVITVNHIQSVVDVLTGFERQNRFDIKADPQGGEDAESSEVLTWILKFVQDQTESAERLSDVFEDGIISGLGCLAVEIDWSLDLLTGKIKVRRLEPGKDVIWDPWWKEYDFSDCRYILRYNMVYIHDLLHQFPEHEEEIMGAVDSLPLNTGMEVSPRSTTDGSAYGLGSTDPYGSSVQHPMENLGIEGLFYDRANARIMVMEAWYRTIEMQFSVFNKETRAVHDFETHASAAEYRRTDTERLSLIRRAKQKIRMATILPATLQTLEHVDTPYLNDKEHYPFVGYVGKKKRNIAYGIVRNLKDPQRVENKRISQIIDILAKYANVRPMAEEGAVRNPASLEEGHSSAPVLYTHGRQPPTWYVPPLAEVARVLTEAGLQSKLNIREISGINTDLLGLKSDDTSGIAIARRQAQGQIISTLFFDNLKRTRKLLGQRLAKRAQQSMTTERILRLTHPETGEPIVVLLNPVAARLTREGRISEEEYKALMQSEQGRGRPYVMSDLSAMEFDVVIAESPSTQSMRAMALTALMDIVGKMPQVLPALVDVIVELADVPNRAKIVRRLRRMMDPAILDESERPTPTQPPTAPGQPPGQGGAPPGAGVIPGGPVAGGPAPGMAGRAPDVPAAAQQGANPGVPQPGQNMQADRLYKAARTGSGGGGAVPTG